MTCSPCTELQLRAIDLYAQWFAIGSRQFWSNWPNKLLRIPRVPAYHARSPQPPVSFSPLPPSRFLRLIKWRSSPPLSRPRPIIRGPFASRVLELDPSRSIAITWEPEEFDRASPIDHTWSHLPVRRTLEINTPASSVRIWEFCIHSHFHYRRVLWKDKGGSKQGIGKD